MDELDWCISQPSTDEGSNPPTDTETTTASSAPRYEEGPELGRGGMGVVAMAHDTLLQRNVALKRLQVDTQQGRARLLQEARVTAQLDHPSIVAVHDAGLEADGSPWYAMRAVRGTTLASAIRAADGLPGRLSLLRPFLEVCHAMAYAHHRGVVHRDLKPSNILLGPFGEVQVMDWGLAVSTRDAPTADTALPSTGGSGAPAYMAPEAFSHTVVTPQLDVWSLGVCLFELLTARPAYVAADHAQLRQAVCARPPPSVHEREPGVPVELAAIVARACAHDPAHRYPSASELATDIEAWLDGRSVSAHDYTAIDTARRLARRNQSVAIGAVLALGAVVVSSVLWGMQLTREQSRTEAARQEAVAEEARARSRLIDALIANAELDVRAHDRLGAMRRALDVLELDPNDPRARGMLTAARPVPVLLSSTPAPSCDSATLDAEDDRVFCLQDDMLRAISFQDGSLLWEQATPGWASMVLAPGLIMGFGANDGFRDARSVTTGELAVAADPDRRRTRTDFHGRSADHLPFRSGEGSTVSLLVSPRADGPAVEVRAPVPILPIRLGQDASGTCYFADRTRSIWTLSPDAPHWQLRVDSGQTHLDNDLLGGAISDDGSTAVFSSGEGMLELVDLDSGAVVDSLSFPAGGLFGLQLSPDGRRVAAMDQHRGVWIWDRKTHQRERLSGPAYELSWRSDGILAIRGEALERWSFPADAFAETWFPGSGVSSLDWHGDVLAVSTGAGLVLGRTGDGGVRFSGQAGLRNVAKDVAVSPDSQRLLGVGLENRWVELERSAGATPKVTSPALPARRIVWLSNLLAASSVSYRLQVRRGDAAGLELVTKPDGTELVAGDLEPAADRQAVVVATLDGEVFLMRQDTAPGLESVAHTDELIAVAAGPRQAGRYPVAIASRHDLALWHSGDRTAQWSVAVSDTILDVAVSSDGQRIATGHLSGHVRIWSAQGELLGDWLAHRDRVSAVVFSPDGRSLATGSWDAAVHLWTLDVLALPMETLQTRFSHLHPSKATAHR